MTNTRSFVVGVAALVVVALSGCSGPTQAPTPTVTPTVTPSPTPTLSAQQQAVPAVVLRFYDVQNRIGSDYTVPLDKFYEVAGGELVRQRLDVFFKYRGRGVTQVGVLVPEIRDVRGDAEPFEVDVCVDTSDLDMRDEQGQSVIAPESPELVLHRFTVQQVGDTLRAVSDEAVETPC